MLALLGATGLAAMGRFRPAIALTLGALVAIVTALWLSDLVGRFSAPGRGATSRIDWKFALWGAFRYLLAGLLLFFGVRWFPGEVPWLFVGLSVVVGSLVVEGVVELRRVERKERVGREE